MVKNFAVIGCGRFGRAVATTLYKLGHDVLAIDKDEEVIQNIADDVTRAVTAIPDESALRDLGVADCDIVIVSMGSDVESSVITTLIVKELKVPYVICKAGSEIQEKILYKIGADRVISPERDSGVKLAKNLVSENILDKIDLDPDYTLFEILTPAKWVGKSLIELDIRKKYHLNIVAIKKLKKFMITPNPEEKLEENYTILLVGSNKSIRQFEQKIKEEII
ncbi:NADP oxidoreductase coenzyme F420-dependent [Peptostreptococcaceae bacterium AS15]|nr:NADP oxidoreductase coenzyme F420-dependent [Peptostreptococcaceae bacterium AS15]